MFEGNIGVVCVHRMNPLAVAADCAVNIAANHTFGDLLESFITFFERNLINLRSMSR